MKHSRKTTEKSSARQKIVQRVKKLAKGSASSPKAAEGSKKSSSKSEAPPAKDLVFEGAIKLQDLSFEDQAKLLFDPLSGINKKLIVGAQDQNDPFAAKAAIIGPK